MQQVFEYAALLEWHKANGRHSLPWRAFAHLDTAARVYRVWLAEILLQQTQAERVVEYYQRMLERYPTLESLADTSYEEFFVYYQGLGYYSRARNLLACARTVVREYGGVFPSETRALVGLPGIGPYTAEAIRAFGYDIPTLSIDTNLEKIFRRYYHGSRYTPLTKAEQASILEDYLTLEGVSAREVNAALMDLGALWSKNSLSQIDWDASPFTYCEFTRTRGAQEIAPVKVRSYFPVLDAQTLVIIHRDHREYYSSESWVFAPFMLAPMSSLAVTPLDTRHFVQEYFRDRYGLELSVRPPRKQGYRAGVPTQIVFAQIQSGAHDWRAYSKVDAQIPKLLGQID